MSKRLIYGKGISAVPAQQYGTRFLKFIKSLVQKAPAKSQS